MNTDALREFSYTICHPSAERFHAGRPRVYGGEGYPGGHLTACGLEFETEGIQERNGHVTCPECLKRLYGLTINGMVDMAYGTAKGAGWHDRTGEVITKEHAYFQLAGMAQIIMAVGRVVEAIRKPDKFDLRAEIDNLYSHANVLRRFGPAFAAETIPEVAGELQTTAQGGITEMLAWLVLLVSEGAEAMEAAIKKDRANFAEELADIAIRMGDDVGAINDMPGHPLGPIDLEADILAKNERNRQRGYRHGGKRA